MESKDLKRLKIGTKVTINSSHTGFTSYKGTVFTVSYAPVRPTMNSGINILNPNGGVMTMYPRQLDFAILKREDLVSQKEELLSEVNDIQNKIDFMDETGTTEYNETEVKVFHTLKLLDKKGLSNLERAKLITKIIDN